MIKKEFCKTNSSLCKKTKLSYEVTELYEYVQNKYKAIEKSMNENLYSVYLARKEISNPSKEINFRDLLDFNYAEKFLYNCVKFEFYFPVYSRYKVEGQYRRLSSEFSSGNLVKIKEELSKYGPQVKNVYWIRITNIKNLQRFTDSILYYGYIPLFDNEEKLNSNDKNSKVENIGEETNNYLTANVLVSHDFRLREERTNLCKYCEIVKNNLFSKKNKDKTKQT